MVWSRTLTRSISWTRRAASSALSLLMMLDSCAVDERYAASARARAAARAARAFTASSSTTCLFSVISRSRLSNRASASKYRAAIVSACARSVAALGDGSSPTACTGAPTSGSIKSAVTATTAARVGTSIFCGMRDKLPSLVLPVEPAPTRWALPAPQMVVGTEIAGIGADLEPGTLLAAYRAGLFPMRLHAERSAGVVVARSARRHPARRPAREPFAPTLVSTVRRCGSTPRSRR